MYDNQNIFAKIIKGKIPAEKVYEDEKVLAFKDINPQAPIHILVIPKKEIISFHDFMEKCSPDEVVHFFQKVRDIAEKEGLQADGYRLISNHGPHAGQEVPHFHVHILGGKRLGRLVSAA